MSNLNNQPTEPGVLELQAFRFVSGEMATEEQAVFEERLVSDPAVAIAVSQIVELEEALGHQPVGQSEFARPVALGVLGESVSPASQRSAVPVIAALVACLIVAAALVRGTNESPGTPDTAVVEQKTELIDNWLEAVEIVSVEPAFAEMEEDVVELAMLDVSDTTGDGSDEVVPGWMYAVFQDEKGTNLE